MGAASDVLVSILSVVTLVASGGLVFVTYNYIKLRRKQRAVLALQEKAESVLTKIMRLSETNAQLKERVHHYSGILDTFEFPIWQRNENLEIIYCNDSYARMVGMNKDDVLKDGSVELGLQSKTIAQHAQKTGKIQKMNSHIVVGGERRLFSITEAAEAGAPFIVGFARDITDQEVIEKKLSQYISMQSDLLESIKSATAVYTADTKLKFFNRAFVNLWKLDERWLENEPTYGEILEALRVKRMLPEQINFPAFKKESLSIFQNIIKKHEEVYYLPDGTVLRALVIPHALGGLLFTYEDLTEKIALERSYNTLLSVQRSTLDSLFEGIAVFGEDGRLKLSNPAFQLIWQLNPEILKPETHVSDFLEAVRELIDTGENWESTKSRLLASITNREYTDEKLERNDGLILDCAGIPLPDGGKLMTYLDISDSIQVERSLRAEREAFREADILKTHFLSNVSYELRSPLTSIKGFSEVLLHSYFGKLNAKQKEYVEGIHDASARLNSFIDHILEIASIDAGFMTLEVEETDLTALINAVTTEVDEAYKKQEVSLKVNLAKNLDQALIDRHRIRQAIVTILKFLLSITEKGGSVILEARGKGKKSVEIMFANDGTPLSATEQKALFERFYRVNETEDIKGSLAMPVAKAFIELHEGTVENYVLDTGEERGNVIRCIFPRYNTKLMKERHALQSNE